LDDAESDFGGERVSGHPVALLLVDVINDFDFPEGDALAQLAAPAVPNIEALAARARAADVPVIYVNDNFGHWRSDFRSTITRCSDPSRRGSPLVRRLLPELEDYFVLKPMHSGFFQTPLELLLDELETRALILCGFATNSCVAFTAHDAHMRGFRVVVPEDTTAANTEALRVDTLRHLNVAVHADTGPAARIDFERLARGGSRRPGAARGSMSRA
jgi:nicotinamidase-related amidase